MRGVFPEIRGARTDGKASCDACGVACERVRKPASGERRRTRRGSVEAPASRAQSRLPARRLNARVRRTRAPYALPASRISRRSVCFFHRFARRGIEEGGGVPRGDARIGRGAHLTSVELGCRGSARVTREPPRVSRAWEYRRALPPTPLSHRSQATSGECRSRLGRNDSRKRPAQMASPRTLVRPSVERTRRRICENARLISRAYGATDCAIFVNLTPKPPRSCRADKGRETRAHFLNFGLNLTRR